MANVAVYEAERPSAEPVNAATIRDAILRRIPEDPNIVRDVKVHDGIADISIRWRALRWSTGMAYSTMTPDQIGEKIDGQFRFWLRNVIGSMQGNPRHSTVIHDMMAWLKANPEKHDWLYAPRQTKTTLEPIPNLEPEPHLLVVDGEVKRSETPEEVSRRSGIAPPSPYEGKGGRHPVSCTCSKHKAVSGTSQAA